MQITIQRCHIRGTRIVPDKTEPETLSWQELCERLAPPPLKVSELKLRRMVVKGYIGLLRVKQQLENFVLYSANEGNNLSWLLKTQPQFLKQLAVIYRVDSISWGGAIQESGRTAQS